MILSRTVSRLHDILDSLADKTYNQYLRDRLWIEILIRLRSLVRVQNGPPSHQPQSVHYLMSQKCPIFLYDLLLWPFL
jgi:hypothetical protein